MSSPIADSVMAATHKLVQQAMQGQWQEVPRTVEQRRVLLNELTANASPQDHQWLSALKQAMVESDAAVAKIAAADVPAANLSPAVAEPAAGTTNTDLMNTGLMNYSLDHVASTLEMLAKRR
jgi:hypothetical protein